MLFRSGYQGLREGRKRGILFNGTEFLFGMMKTFWKCTALLMYLIALNCTVKSGLNGKFHVMYILPQQKKIKMFKKIE